MSKYIAVAAEDQKAPIVENTPHDAAVAAKEAFGLSHNHDEIDNWEKRTSNLDGHTYWLIKTGTQWWHYASIHEVDSDE